MRAKSLLEQVTKGLVIVGLKTIHPCFDDFKPLFLLEIVNQFNINLVFMHKPLNRLINLIEERIVFQKDQRH